MTTDELSYPIGRFFPSIDIDQNQIDIWIKEIEQAPEQYEQAVKGLSDEQLDTPYRPNGWTIRQVIHHIPDSHMNSYIRFHWALTENNPTIKAYDEKAWADLAYQGQVPIQLSINLVKAIHSKWVILLNQLSAKDLEKTFVHPDTGKALQLKSVVGLYAWHSKHHLQHILELRSRMNW